MTERFEWFAVDRTGTLWIDPPGLYTRVLTSDDGARIWTDDQLIIDNDPSMIPEDRTGGIRLAALARPSVVHR